ncbi:MAG: DUF1800 family protein [Planctomycetes bacterium]|nr:DUF1800 family protein [Planctomycetota bacterium]
MKLRRNGLAVILLAACAALGGSSASAQITGSGGVIIIDPVPIEQYRPFMRGDANVDGAFDIGDVIRILDYLFPPPLSPSLATLTCHDAADTNDDDMLDIGDAIYALSSLFSGGAPPPAPYGQCGEDPTNPDTLSCNAYPPCNAFTDDDLAGHLLRRIAYGPTPDLLDHVVSVGAEAYIQEQLHPELIDESGNTTLNTLLGALSPSSVRNDLWKMHFFRGLYSEKQLLQQLVDFWEVHFNTWYWTLRNHFRNELGGLYDNNQALALAIQLEYDETELFRSLALSSFEDLLVASATSPAMLIYLDSDNNVVGAPNENYARELMELHTLGADVVYTQDDIVQVARAFTGWTVCKKAPADYGDPHAPCLDDSDPTGVWSFHFEPSDHDYGEKVIFTGVHQLVLPAGDPINDPLAGINDGYMILSHLAGLSETAEFVCRKLISKFVVDNPPTPLVADCIATWLSTNGDMRAVVETILTSDQFLGNAYRWDKIETPTESLLTTIRAFDGYTSSNILITFLSDLNHLPHNFVTPDGFPEIDTLGTHKLLYRIAFAARLYSANDPSYDLPLLLADHGIPLDDVEAIVDYFIRLLYQSNVSVLERQLAIDYLSTDHDGVVTPLDPMAGDYESRLSEAAAFLACFPQSVQE